MRSHQVARPLCPTRHSMAGVPQFQLQGAEQNDLCKIERPLHPGMFDLPFPKIGKPRAASPLVLDNRRRPFLGGPIELACPDRQSGQEALRRGLQTPGVPVARTPRWPEDWCIVEVIQVATDQRGLLESNAIGGEQVGHPSRGVDRVVGAVGDAGLRLLDPDPVAEVFFNHRDSCHPGIGRVGRHIELHRVTSVSSHATASSVRVVKKGRGSGPWETAKVTPSGSRWNSAVARV